MLSDLSLDVVDFNICRPRSMDTMIGMTIRVHFINLDSSMIFFFIISEKLPSRKRDFIKK